MKRKLIILILLTTFLISCNNNVEKDNSILEIKVNPQKVATLKFSDIFSHAELIPLKTDADCLIDEIEYMKVYDEYIFISDNEKLYQFDKRGNFIQTIGQKGKGPEELESIERFHYYQKDQKIEIMDFYGKKIVEYDQDGQFENQFKFNIWAFDYKKLNDSIYLFHSGFNPNPEANNSINIYNKNKGEFIKGHFPIHETLAWYYYIIQARYLYENNNDFYCVHDPFDTIYKVNGLELKPAIYLNYGENRLPKDVVYTKHDDIEVFDNYVKTRPYVTSINHFCENQSYIFHSFRFKGILHHMYYDKTKEQSYVSKKIIDDIKFNKLELAVDYPNTPKAFDEKAFYFKIDAYLFIDYLKQIKDNCSKQEWNEYLSKHPDIKAINEKVNIDNNPIIGVYYLKNE